MFSDFQTVIQDFNQLLTTMVERDASDLFITAGLPPSFKIHGVVEPVIEQSLSAQQTHQLAYNLMDRQLRKEFERDWECNFAIARPESGRFRVNIFKQHTTQCTVDIENNKHEQGNIAHSWYGLYQCI